ncbi:MAG TPA: hypothetical protein VNI01_10080 [Elusimicrobiota bacterium]|nr:hypothetical protein [Elusimicrobiota bacterium]
MTDELKTASLGHNLITGDKGAVSADLPTARPSPDIKTESTNELAVEFAAVAALLEPLKGPAPSGEVTFIWCHKVLMNGLPRLRALIRMADTHPSAPEPLQSAFLLNRYSAIYVAACMAGWTSWSKPPKWSYFTPMCGEPDVKAHLAKHGNQPGVAAAVVAYTKWYATVANLGMPSLEFLSESRRALESM